jgi:hypothetical protein
MESLTGMSAIRFAQFITDEATDEEREGLRAMSRLFRYRRSLRQPTDPQ